MKQFILLLMLALIGLTSCSQSSIKQDAAGNFIAVRSSAKKVDSSKPTGKTYTDIRGDVFPIYTSVNGKLFVIKTSKKSGKQYKQYLKLN